MSDQSELIGALGGLSPQEFVGIEIGFVLWHFLTDADAGQARAAMAVFAADQESRATALQERTNLLVEIGSMSTFPAGLARISGAFVAVTIAVTEGDFVVLDARPELEPTKELARLPRRSISDAVILDADGQPVADETIDPVRELESGADGYTLVLRRADGDGALPPIGLLFRSAEPAGHARDRFREFIIRRHEVSDPPAEPENPRSG